MALNINKLLMAVPDVLLGEQSEATLIHIMTRRCFTAFKVAETFMFNEIIRRTHIGRLLASVLYCHAILSEVRNTKSRLPGL